MKRRCVLCSLHRVRTPCGGAMLWSIVARLAALLLDLVTLRARPDLEKDLEILLLRHQVRLLQRRQPRQLRLSRWEKLPLAVLPARLARRTVGSCARWRRSLVLVAPETVLRWHRDLVRRKW